MYMRANKKRRQQILISITKALYYHFLLSLRRVVYDIKTHKVCQTDVGTARLNLTWQERNKEKRLDKIDPDEQNSSNIIFWNLFS